MGREVQQIIGFIRYCVEQAEKGNDTTLDIREHFFNRMLQRGIFWTDVLATLLDPKRVEPRGFDEEHRQQVWVFGSIRGIGDIRIVCSIDWDTRLITLNWDEP